MSTPLKPELILYCLLLFAGLACVIYAALIEPFWLEVKSLDIHTDKLKDTGLRVVHISDLHCDTVVRNENRLVGIINGLAPDIIVFTGDAVNKRSALPLFKNTLGRLKAGLGKYAVTGNTDEQHWPDLDFFGKTGFKELDGESEPVEKEGEKICITGFNYGNLRGYESVLKNIPGENYSILLYHKPDLAESLKPFNVDLYLAGHTHGGQVALPFYGAIVTLSKYGKRYESGKYVVGDTVLYVTKGVGMIGPRVRFFARPEITVIDIKPKK